MKKKSLALSILFSVLAFACMCLACAFSFIIFEETGVFSNVGSEKAFEAILATIVCIFFIVYGYWCANIVAKRTESNNALKVYFITMSVMAVVSIIFTISIEFDLFAVAILIGGLIGCFIGYKIISPLKKAE